MKIAVMQQHGESRKWLLDEIRVPYESEKYYELEAKGFKLVGVEVKNHSV